MSHSISGGPRLYLRRQADNLGRYVLGSLSLWRPALEIGLESVGWAGG